MGGDCRISIDRVHRAIYTYTYAKTIDRGEGDATSSDTITFSRFVHSDLSSDTITADIV